MREQPTYRIPLGILLLFIGIIAYAVIIARYAPSIIDGWPVWVQTIIYLILGVVWLLPLKRFMIWMETGSFSPPKPPQE